MSGWSLGRIRAVVVTDLRLRLRQTSTLIAFLLLSGLPYLWVPDPATGMAVFVVGGRRVVYDSTALALSTAVLGSILLGLVGFYLVSHALARDLRTRCGFVVASTPVKNGEYLVAKFLGHLALLATLGAGFMACSMAMQLVRGEAPLDPRPYLVDYLLLLTPALVFVAAVAVLFESVPRLSGKLGDVLFFVGWMTVGGLGAVLQGLGAPRVGPGWVALVDVSGLGFAVRRLRLLTGSDSFSIGATSFDPALEPLTLPSLSLGGESVLLRLAALLPAIPVLLLAIAAFHRFDPSRVGGVATRRGRGYLERLEALAAPLVRPWLRSALAGAGRAGSLPGAVVTEAALILLLQPLAAVALVLCAILSLVLPTAMVAGAVLPGAVAVLGVTLAGAAGREVQHGTASIVTAFPRLGRWYVGWKLAAALTVGAAFTLLPACRLLPESPRRTVSILVGTFFVAATATALGSVPKIFLVLFLTLLYVATNDAGRTPGLDFAGLTGTAGPTVWLAYLGLAAVATSLATLSERRRRAAR